MTAPVDVTSTQPSSKSRRALLAGALGGLGALAASAVGRVSPVRAANGEPVLLGQENAATDATSIANSSGAQNGDALRVQASSGGGAGLFAQAAGPIGTGVYGSGTGYGLFGQSTSGVGGYFASSDGVALQVLGRTRLSTSGVATIPSGSTSIAVEPGVNVTSGTFVLLTPKANIGSRALWFTTNATSNTFTIRMSSSRSSNTKVAWLLLG